VKSSTLSTETGLHSRFTRREASAGKEYVGIDLHRRRSAIYRIDEAGKKVDCVRINNPVWFVEEVSKAPKGCDVVIEATYGWYWAVDFQRWTSVTRSISATPMATIGANVG
jgi:hypothetical protein